MHGELQLIIGRLEDFAAKLHDGLETADWASNATSSGRWSSGWKSRRTRLIWPYRRESAIGPNTRVHEPPYFLFYIWHWHFADENNVEEAHDMAKTVKKYRFRRLWEIVTV